MAATGTKHAQEALLKDLCTYGCREEDVPEKVSMKTDCSRSEMLTQPGTMPQKQTDGKLPRCKTYPRFKLVTQEKKHPMGTMPMRRGIRDPRDGAEAHAALPECKEQREHRDLRKV